MVNPAGGKVPWGGKEKRKTEGKVVVNQDGEKKKGGDPPVSFWGQFSQKKSTVGSPQTVRVRVNGKNRTRPRREKKRAGLTKRVRPTK